jgi:hypothetical protein
MLLPRSFGFTSGLESSLDSRQARPIHLFDTRFNLRFADQECRLPLGAASGQRVTGGKYTFLRPERAKFARAPEGVPVAVERESLPEMGPKYLLPNIDQVAVSERLLVQRYTISSGRTR